jgi:hypothetical protein
MVPKAQQQRERERERLTMFAIAGVMVGTVDIKEVNVMASFGAVDDEA